MKISVIIPTHNRPELLERAIRSALDQTRLPGEIIIVDDLGLDETKKVVDSFGTSDCEVKCLRYSEENSWAPQSRNFGSRHAKYDILSFLDDDDFWDKSYLEKAVRLMLDEKSQIIITHLMAIDEFGQTQPGKAIPERFEFEDYFLANPGVLSSNVIILKDIFENIGRFDCALKGSCDKDLLLQVISHGYKHSILTERLVYGYRHSGQWSSDSRLLLPGIVAFYRKYALNMNVKVHFKMWRKIARVYFDK